MRKTFTIGVGSHLAASGEVGSPLEAWQEAALFFRQPRRMTVPAAAGTVAFDVSLDPRDVLTYLSLVKDVETGDEAAAARLQRRFSTRLRAGQGMTGADLRVAIRLPTKAPAPMSDALNAFLQKLFLATNLACPGACDLGTMLRGSGAEDIGGLHADQIAFAVAHAIDRAWPRLRRISVAEAWEWLDRICFDQTVLAVSPVAKALLTLLNIARSDFDHAYVFVQIAGVLESMFADRTRSVSAAVKERVEMILGRPATHRNWFSKLYEVRSRIVHGSEAIVRQGSSFNELPQTQEHMASSWPSLDQIIAIHVALLQELVLRRASAFQFTESLSYVPVMEGKEGASANTASD